MLYHIERITDMPDRHVMCLSTGEERVYKSSEDLWEAYRELVKHLPYRRPTA